MKELLRDKSQLNEANETTLVEKAQGGDREAFGELIRRHRAKVYGYARSITHETFTAEDIVQDAMIRAFLHLSKLTDKQRFLPWIQTIVRNQAYTTMKRQSDAKEQVFTAIKRDCDGDLEPILNRLIDSHSNSDCDHNPEGLLLRKELVETLIKMVRCLSRREREIFESHFFDQLPPGQIAELFHTSSANVYQVISRSRKKLVQERIRVTVDQYIKDRRDLRRMEKAVLSEPKTFTGHHCETWTSAAGALFGMLGYTDKTLSLPMVMGLTGHAFRINVIEKDIHIAGPTMYDFGKVLSQGLHNVGFGARYVDDLHEGDQPGPNYHFVDEAEKTDKARLKRQLPETFPKALELINNAIDRGHAVLVWDLVDPEFSLIYGYDDTNRSFTVRHHHGDDRVVPYEHLGRGTIEDLFVLAIDQPVDMSKPEMLKAAFTMILDHYQGKDEQASGCVSGLNAYDAWIRAFQSRSIEPVGNAYNIAVVQDARLHASHFFEEMAEGWFKDDRIIDLSQEASAIYREISQPLAELNKMFPFFPGGEPNDPQQAEKAIQLLQTAKSIEQRAVESIKKMDARLEELMNT